MSKEKKVRGRRDKEKKQKNEASLAQNDDFVSLNANEKKSEQDDKSESKPGNTVTPFFGLVNASELEYFKQAESTLNINAVETPEERLGFIASVFEEAKGKELKLVTNQICSKLIERLILSASPKQMKQLFKSFNGHALPLSNQKYSSHCMETFLIRCAFLVEKEILKEKENDYGQEIEEEEEEEEDEEGTITMESVFLYIVGELMPYLHEILVHQYASHVLRVILFILAGKQIPSSIESNSILRSKKSKIARKMIDIKDNEDYQRSYQVPSSFKDELSEVLKAVIKGQTTESLRELAIQKVASPVIQLLIQLEGLVDKERTFWNTVFNKFEDGKDPKEEAFVEYLLSDPIGSHFLETCLQTQRVKNITRLYNLYMKDRILKLAKRDTTGVYVVQVVMKRVRPVDQLEILDNLVPHLNEIIVNNLEIGQAVVDCSIERNDYKRPEIVEKFKEFFNKSLTASDEEVKSESNQSQILENVLRLSTSTLGNTKDDWPTAEERRRAFFLEKLIAYDQSILDASIEGLLELPQERLIQMCYHGVFSHVVESVLDPMRVSIVNRRRLLNALVDNVVLLSCNAQASHIVDKLWDFTIKLNMYKDRIAKALFDGKDKVKNSVYGKQVWKNWSMEMYCRRLGDWKRLIKTQELEKFPPKETPAESTPAAPSSAPKSTGGASSHKRRDFNDSPANSSFPPQKKQKVRGRNRG